MLTQDVEEENEKEEEFVGNKDKDKDNDSLDGGVLVNGHEAEAEVDEEWVTDNAGNPSAA